MNILSTKLFEVGSTCYFLCSSTDTPFIYTKCKGTIRRRQIQNDSIGYWISFDEILETSDYIKQFVHRNTFRMWNMISNRGQLKQITCFDLTVYMPTFNKEFSKRLQSFTIPLTSVFVFDNAQDMNGCLAKTIDTINEHFKVSLEQLEYRKLS